MEIKTIEELACIPVENDDFAAASDQGEGDVILRPSLNYWQDAWRRLRKNPVAILAIVMLAALAVMCVVGPGMTGYDYDAVSLSEKNALPSSEHWFGTDKMGRDLFTRVWIGGRISMILGIAGAAIDMLIGVVYGGVAAYFGGKTDAIMMRIVEILASIPYLLLVVRVSNSCSVFIFIIHDTCFFLKLQVFCPLFPASFSSFTFPGCVFIIFV